MISFEDDPAANVVDKWLDLKDLNDDEDEVIHPSVLAATAAPSNQRLGLGFQPSSSAAKTAALAQNLKKDKKRKHTGLSAEDEDFLEEMHGLVEDDLMEESRIKVFSKKHDASNTASQKKSKTPAAKTNNSEKPAPPALEPAPAPAPVPNASPAAPAGSEEEMKGEKKRKRVKTRSKQKNIRRDNRPESAKPAHLLPGSKEYKGRPLTPETKAILHLPPTKPKVLNRPGENGGNSNNKKRQRKERWQQQQRGE